MSGTFEAEYKYAVANPGLPECKTLLALVALYRRRPDAPTLGLLQGAADEVRRVMRRRRVVV